MSKPWPYDTLEKLRDAGYSFQDSSACTEPSCGKMIYWFFTPNKKRMPFEMVAGTVAGVPNYLPHFATCPAAKRFSGSGGHR